MDKAICPSCGVEIPEHRCRKCGATRNVSQVSGNVIWMRNGRLISAFQDAKQAYVKMAEKYGVAKELWPDKFRQ